MVPVNRRHFLCLQYLRVSPKNENTYSHWIVRCEQIKKSPTMAQKVFKVRQVKSVTNVLQSIISSNTLHY